MNKAADIASAVRSGRSSALSVLEDTLARIDASASLGAFTDICSDRARTAAASVDGRIAAGEDPGPLAGVPVAVKNLYDIKGLTTRAGSRINRSHPPATEDATLVARLEAAGAVLVGALNMGEYAYDFTGENVHDGPSRNPHAPNRMSGGSSGGSGVAVAAGLVPIALGTDTNGSIRVPSALCGCFGLKPTYGRLPRTGTFPFVASLDHVGPMARSVMDLALSYDVMQGPDAGDPACAAHPLAPTVGDLAKGADGIRIAVAGGYFARGGQPDAFEAVARAAQALDATRIVEIPDTGIARATAYIITMAEGATLHLDRLRSSSPDFDPAVRERLIAGAMLPAAWVQKAQKFRRIYAERVSALFADVDVILAPATPCHAPLIGQQSFVLDGLEMPVRPNLGVFTQPISFIGLPVVTAPIFLEEGTLPLGVQVIAAPWREDLALRVAQVLETHGVATSPLARPIG
jgi:AtzE family amidohydrolase